MKQEVILISTESLLAGVQNSTTQFNMSCQRQGLTPHILPLFIYISTGNQWGMYRVSDSNIKLKYFININQPTVHKHQTQTASNIATFWSCRTLSSRLGSSSAILGWTHVMTGLQHYIICVCDKIQYQALNLYLKVIKFNNICMPWSHDNLLYRNNLNSITKWTPSFYICGFWLSLLYIIRTMFM
jgi:hypothetical protein